MKENNNKQNINRIFHRKVESLNDQSHLQLYGNHVFTDDCETTSINPHSVNLAMICSNRWTIASLSL